MKKVVEDRHSVRVLCTLFIEMSHFHEHAAFQDGSHTR